MSPDQMFVLILIAVSVAFVGLAARRSRREQATESTSEVASQAAVVAILTTDSLSEKD